MLASRFMRFRTPACSASGGLLKRSLMPNYACGIPAGNRHISGHSAQQKSFSRYGKNRFIVLKHCFLESVSSSRLFRCL